MNTSITTASGSKSALFGSGILQTVRGAVTQIAGYIGRLRETRATYRALRDLDDRMLRDIGLSRSDVIDLQNFGRHR